MSEEHSITEAPTNKDKLIQLDEIPHIDINTLLNEAGTNDTQYLGRGNSGLVIKIGNRAAKIGLAYGLPKETSTQIARLVHPDSPNSQSLLTKKLSADNIHFTTFEQQAAAHQLGHQINPNLIDEDVSLITIGNRTCGLTLPFYSGEFMSISNPQFGVSSSEITELESAGIKIDSFTHRKNGVILNDGQRRIFDIQVPTSMLNQQHS